MAAAATSRNGAVGGNPAIGMIGAQGVIERSLLAYQRAQEEQADRAGVGFLKATGQSPKGMYETFKRFADQMLFSAGRADPYLQSHPMPTERLSALAEIAKNDANWNKKDPPELQARHDLMRAKLFGFMERPDTLLRRYPPSDTSLPARYARAVSTYRHADLHLALGQMDALIQAQPGNPYFYELKGQALVEAGHAQEAIGLLRHAISLAPDPTLMRVLLGQALVSTSNAALQDEAVATLRHALATDPDLPDAYDQLAMAYGRKNALADADLASAEAALARGQLPVARQLASRAKGRFPVGSPGWVKADDIASVKPPPKPHLF
jgi:predicted Zn-dependent protease